MHALSALPRASEQRASPAGVLPRQRHVANRLESATHRQSAEVHAALSRSRTLLPGSDPPHKAGQTESDCSPALGGAWRAQTWGSGQVSRGRRQRRPFLAVRTYVSGLAREQPLTGALGVLAGKVSLCWAAQSRGGPKLPGSAAPPQHSARRLHHQEPS